MIGNLKTERKNVGERVTSSNTPRVRNSYFAINQNLKDRKTIVNFILNLSQRASGFVDVRA